MIVEKWPGSRNSRSIAWANFLPSNDKVLNSMNFWSLFGPILQPFQKPELLKLVIYSSIVEFMASDSSMFFKFGR